MRSSRIFGAINFAWPLTYKAIGAVEGFMGYLTFNQSWLHHCSTTQFCVPRFLALPSVYIESRYLLIISVQGYCGVFQLPCCLVEEMLTSWYTKLSGAIVRLALRLCNSLFPPKSQCAISQILVPRPGGKPVDLPTWTWKIRRFQQDFSLVFDV